MSQGHRKIIETLGLAARSASQVLAHMPTESINSALVSCASALRQNTEAILAANTKDLDIAAYKNLSPALLDRLTLTPERIDGGIMK